MKRNWKIIVGILFLVGGFGCISSDVQAAAFGIIAGAALVYWWIKDREKSTRHKEDAFPTASPQPEAKQHEQIPPKAPAQAAPTPPQAINRATALFYDSLKNLPLVEIIPSETVTDYPLDKNRDLLFHSTNITARTPLSRLSSYFAVDIETTGLKYRTHEIVQVSAIRFENFQPVEAFSTYIKPRKGIKPEARQINGITERDVENAPYIEEIADQLNAFLTTGHGEMPPVVGHKLQFDYNFLFANKIYAVAGNRKLYDTLELSRRQFSGLPMYKLDYLAETVLDIFRSEAHDSLPDAMVAGLLFKKICQERIGF